jgi:4-amino-4-deoxy-L-arabinose transferase-like glycosyltransferase
MTTTLHSPADSGPAEHPQSAPPGRSWRFTRVWRGREQDAAWVRPALLGLLLATALLYMWDLGASGWANSFYSAAVQAGSKSWEAFFFGSSDASNAITVDKPPLSLWPMELSVRIFGLSSWSILLPQAVMGVASVGLLFTIVRRHFGAAAGLLAGAVLAGTPVAALMFRFNNPDAMLVLLMTAGVYFVLRAVEHAKVRWLILAGVMVGLAFLTKQLQALLVVPAFGLTYLWAAPTTFLKRIGHLLAGLAAMIVAAGWWIAIVELTPASHRPFIGGSQNNSILELTFGYNGFGRLTGDETGSVGSNGNWGATGITRMFGSEFGGQISWLLPAALILLVAGLVATRKLPRTSRVRAAFIIWGGWLVTTWLTFSLMQGIIHPYYSVALAPAIAAVVGIGVTTLWKQRSAVATFVLAGTVLVTALWSYTLLARSSDWHPWIRYVVLLTGVIAALGLAGSPWLAGRLEGATRRRVMLGIGALALVSGLLGPVGYSLNTASTAHTGSIPSAGPSVSQTGFGGGGRGGGGGGGFGGGQAPGGTQSNTQGGTPGSTQGGTQSRGGFGGGGGAGGLLNATTPSADLVTALESNASSYKWVAATVGSNNASGYQLATEDPVMAVGGFNGTDPSPTLAEFEAYVTSGQIHYFIASSTVGGTSTSGSNAAEQITSWVESNFTATTIGGTTVYDLSTASSNSGA